MGGVGSRVRGCELGGLGKMGIGGACHDLLSRCALRKYIICF